MTAQGWRDGQIERESKMYNLHDSATYTIFKAIEDKEQYKEIPTQDWADILRRNIYMHSNLNLCALIRSWDFYRLAFQWPISSRQQYITVEL